MRKSGLSIRSPCGKFCPGCMVGDPALVAGGLVLKKKNPRADVSGAVAAGLKNK